ncbi:hypothetical protein D3C72_1708520 [compost metagenome]
MAPSTINPVTKTPFPTFSITAVTLLRGIAVITPFALVKYNSEPLYVANIKVDPSAAQPSAVPVEATASICALLSLSACRFFLFPFPPSVAITLVGG